MLTRVRQTLWPPTTVTNPALTWLNATETDFVLASIIQRRNRWRQMVAWVALAFTAVTVAAIIALFQRNEALRQEQEARRHLAISESQRLSRFAQDLLANQPEQALLLAYEAGARDDNAFSNQALWDSLDRVPLGSSDLWRW